MAVDAAADCLRRGGNAVDAAVVASAVQCVTEPGSCGLGGDLFALVHSDDEGTWALNGSGRAPLQIEEVLGGQKAPRFGALSPSVPGTPAAWDLMLNRFGSIDTSEALDPAIRYAKDGFSLYDTFCEMINRIGPELENNLPLKKLFIENPSTANSLFKQPKLASTLSHLASSGIREFYDGDIAQSIVRDCQAQGGILAVEDMRIHNAEFVEPITTEFGNTHILTQPPVSMGLIFLMELMLLEEVQPGCLPSVSEETIDLLVRCKHAAFLDGPDALKAGVPEAWQKQAAEEIYRRQIDGSTWGPGGTDTTCVVVSDGRGLVVSIIHSLFNEFGSRTLLPDSGIVLNDRLANNLIGAQGLQGGDRAVHTLHSYLVLEDGIPIVMACTPGGKGQVQINFQIICRILKEGMDVKSAVDAPRWLSGNPRRPNPMDTLFLETGIAPEIASALESKGHRVQRCNASDVDMFGSCLVTGFDKKALNWYAVADKRRDARAIEIKRGV